jgi:two-component system phosphate regulon sensor histidine kinase PhoR
VQQKRIYIWLAGISFLLILLIGIQLVWLRNAARVQAEENQLHVLRALEKTESLVKNELYCFEMFSKGFVGANEGIYIVRQKVDSLNFVGEADTLAFYMNTESRIPDTPLYKVGPLYVGYPMTAEIHANFRLEPADTGVSIDLARRRYEDFSGKHFNDMLSTKKSIDSLFSMKLADSLLRKSLADENIDASYGFAFILDDGNKVAFAKRVTDTAGLLKSPYQLRVFSDNKFMQSHRLAVLFTENLNANAGNYWLYISIIIIAVLAISFYFFVRLYIKQTRLSEMKSDFINNLTHEFNTPMANISLALETLTEQDHVKDPKVERIFNIISTESGRLQENIERALQVATMEKGNLHLHIEQTDLVATINTITSAYQLQAEQLDGSITFIHPSQSVIEADETHLLNCICNLLDNAIKYRQGPPHITITLEDKDDQVAITVSDNGKGMNTETQKQIFNKFYRAHEGDTHNTKGFGLGLSYVKGIIDAHNGRISVWSKPGIGTKFTIILSKNSVYA